MKTDLVFLPVAGVQINLRKHKNTRLFRLRVFLFLGFKVPYFFAVKAGDKASILAFIASILLSKV